LAGAAARAEGRLAFAEFVFDPARQELSRHDGQPIALTPKSLALLRYLLAHPGRVLAKDELIGALWGAVIVTDDSLVQCVKDLRGALGDRAQRLLKTLPRRGYMFDVVVQAAPAGAAVQAEALADAGASSARAATPVVPSRDTGWRRTALAGWLLVLLTLLGGALVWWHDAAPGVGIDEELRLRRSIAVLAFHDSAGRAAGAPLGDQLADAVAGQLVRDGTRVIGRGGTLWQDPAAPEFERIGREQGVRYVLAGRITRANGRVSIDTYLTEVSSGAVYRLDETDLAAGVGPDLAAYAQQVARALEARTVEIEVERARLPGHEKNPVDRLVLGWRELDRGNMKADLERARAHFAAAAQADPTSYEATLGLGVSQLALFYAFQSATPARTVEEAEQTLRRALDLAPDNPRTLSAWAEVLLLRQRPEAAIWLWNRALEIAPDNASIRLRLANAMLRQGSYAAAHEHMAKVSDLRPYELRRQQALYQLQADLAFAQGRDEEAYGVLQHWRAEFPNSGRPYAMLAAIDALNQRDAAAAEHMARYRQMLPLGNIAYVIQTYPSNNPDFLAQRARLVQGLKQAGLPEEGR